MQRNPWCNSRLKVSALSTIAQANLRKDILSQDETSWGGAENLRLPDAQRSLVQLRPQESSTQQITGWATRWSPYCTGELKLEGVKAAEFSSGSLAQGAKKNIVQYLGIAADEPERIERHTKPGIMLPLVEIGWDEAYCRRLCEENGLLSPIYTTASRGGCWFCHNQSVDQLRLLRKNYPDLWALLLKWDADSPVSFKPDGHTVHDYDRRFFAEDLNLVPSDRRFRWKKLEEDEVVEAMENYAPAVGSAALGAPKEE